MKTTKEVKRKVKGFGCGLYRILGDYAYAERYHGTGFIPKRRLGIHQYIT